MMGGSIHYEPALWVPTNSKKGELPRIESMTLKAEVSYLTLSKHPTTGPSPFRLHILNYIHMLHTDEIELQLLK